MGKGSAWTDAEDAILRKHFRNGNGAGNCYRLLGGKRSNSAIHGRAYKIGLIGCRMSKTNVLLKMHDKPFGSLFNARSVGGNIDLLESMQKDGLISSKEDRWFLSVNQHAALSFLFAESKP